MHWRVWNTLAIGLDYAGVILAAPGALLLDWSDRCYNRMARARAMAVSQISDLKEGDVIVTYYGLTVEQEMDPKSTEIE